MHNIATTWETIRLVGAKEMRQTTSRATRTSLSIAKSPEIKMRKKKKKKKKCEQ
jgi:hypothetical protein